MIATLGSDWQKDFGLGERASPNFFSSKDSLDQTVPQAHVLRRAFDLLDLDGVLCVDNAPLIYFKQVDRIDTEYISEINRRFWNHGGAPVLVVISPKQVHVYSGLCRPVAQSSTTGELPSLVTVIDRVATALCEFLVSVESGEFFHRHGPAFNPDQRVDRDLLDNLKDTRDKLDEDRFDLRLLSSINHVDRIPVEGKNRIIIANVKGVLHFRFFDGNGHIVVDINETNLTGHVYQIEALRKQLSGLWGPHKTTRSESSRIVAAITSIVGHTHEDFHERLDTQVLDALLCRLVFTCYLFDRGVIDSTYLIALGIDDASHLRDILGIHPAEDAKAALYRLFRRLGEDFNGDLFSDDLNAESNLILPRHIQTLGDFFRGTIVRTGQTSFWPYDFGCIPIEAISAIYEQFLKSTDEQTGAFYTPRFLAEVVLDNALSGFPKLIGKRFLDPACGSGIFLVGLFNRLAEEWKQANPDAPNDKKASALMHLLQHSLFGADISGTACRITAFSLYLAYLDQLSPRGIQELQQKGRALPTLIVPENDPQSGETSGNIRRIDFFDESMTFPKDVALVIGNPPWGGIAKETTLAGQWCAAHGKPLPDKQIAAAFVWKAVDHVAEDGRVCFVLPHGLIFNHSTTAIPFQKSWVRSHTIDRVLNLADLRFLLFEKAIHPAIVVSYRKLPPCDFSHSIEYWTPKADWTVTKAEVITISPQDRTSLTVGEVLKDLESPDAPQIWKHRYWATPRDSRLLDRLTLYARLRDIVRQPRDKMSSKRWLMAEGVQPVGAGDDPDKAKTISLPSTSFIGAASDAVDLFLLPDDCEQLGSTEIAIRDKSNRNTQIFRKPHVLVTKGFTRIAFADFDVSFRHALRGINGPESDRDLLAFLAAYLRTPLARYFLFHTSSNWGIYRPEVHVDEVLRVPFPLPDQLPNPLRSWEIVREVARLVFDAADESAAVPLVRARRIRDASIAIEGLVEDYFDVLPMEKTLIADTMSVTIPSIQPTQHRMPVETVIPSSAAHFEVYKDCLCKLLNGWAKRSGFVVRGQTFRSEALGIGLVVLEKVEREKASSPMPNSDADLLEALSRLRKAVPRTHATLDLVRGVMIFDKNRLYVVKPIGQRNWTQTAAMNDADEIAGTLLMRSSREDA